MTQEDSTVTTTAVTQVSAASVQWELELKGADMLFRSGLCPKDVKSKETALFIIMAGRDLGLSAVQSLRSIRPVMGKLECSADLQLGLFHRSGGKSKWLKLTDTEVELELLSQSLQKPHVSRWTIEDARRAQLANKDVWRQYPRAMLRSRAITSGLKDIGFIESSGVYAPGELGGGVTVDATGEVIPTSDELVSEVAKMALPQQTSATDGALSETDDDGTQQKILDWANQINEAFLAHDPDKAFQLYKDAKADLDDATAQVALRGQLSSKCKTMLRTMADDELKQSIKAGVPTDESLLSEIEDRCGKAKTDEQLDFIKDLARGLQSTEAQRKASLLIDDTKKRLEGATA